LSGSYGARGEIRVRFVREWRGARPVCTGGGAGTAGLAERGAAERAENAPFPGRDVHDDHLRARGLSEWLQRREWLQCDLRSVCVCVCVCVCMCVCVCVCMCVRAQEWQVCVGHTCCGPARERRSHATPYCPTTCTRSRQALEPTNSIKRRNR
jgi:hypothetical protein